MEYLEKLLSETSDDSTMDVEKVKALTEKLQEMNGEEKERTERVNLHFQTLRAGIDETTGYLQKAKKDLDNLKFSYQACERLQADNRDYEAFLEKSEEEIDAEMLRLTEQLEGLEKRVKDLNTSSEKAEEGFNNVIKKLESLP